MGHTARGADVRTMGQLSVRSSLESLTATLGVAGLRRGLHGLPLYMSTPELALVVKSLLGSVPPGADEWLSTQLRGHITTLAAAGNGGRLRSLTAAAAELTDRSQLPVLLASLAAVSPLLAVRNTADQLFAPRHASGSRPSTAKRPITARF